MTPPQTLVLLTSVAGWRGSATSYLKIARGLAANGWSVRAIVGGQPVAEPFESAGFDTDVVAYSSTGVRSARDLAKRLRRARSSVVVADTPRDMRNAVLARLFGGPPVVYRYNLSYRAPHRGVGERLYLRATAGCVFQSRAIMNEFLAAYPGLASRPRWLIPNGYDTEAEPPDVAEVTRLRDRLDLPGGAVVVCGAMLASRKGHDLLFEAMADAWSRGARFSLVVCGDGGDAGIVASRAATMPCPVRFTGMLDGAGMRAAFALADVVVHPSEREIFPNVVAEAMLAGSAVVAVDSGATGEVIGDAGLLVPPGDAASMAAAVMQLLGDPSRRAALGQAARRRVIVTFPLERMIDGYRRVLDAVAAGGATTPRS